MSQRVLVTGATGRIGRHVVRMLALAGVPTRCLCLPNDPYRYGLRSLGVEVHEGRLEDADAVRRAVADVTDVLHLAAAIHYRGATDFDMIRSITWGTQLLVESLLDQAGRADDVRFVYDSSTSVYVDSRERSHASPPVDEACSERPSTPYGAAKYEAELIVRRAAEQTGFAAAIVRPCDTANPSEILHPRSVFSPRWFVRAALEAASDRSYESLAPLARASLAHLDECRRELTDSTLYFIHPLSAKPPRVQISSAYSVAERIVEALDRAKCGPTPIYNIIPYRSFTHEEFVGLIARRLGIETNRIQRIVVSRFDEHWHFATQQLPGLLASPVLSERSR